MWNQSGALILYRLGLVPTPACTHTSQINSPKTNSWKKRRIKKKMKLKKKGKFVSPQSTLGIDFVLNFGAYSLKKIQKNPLSLSLLVVSVERSFVHKLILMPPQSKVMPPLPPSPVPVHILIYIPPPLFFPPINPMRNPPTHPPTHSQYNLLPNLFSFCL